MSDELVAKLKRANDAIWAARATVEAIGHETINELGLDQEVGKFAFAASEFQASLRHQMTQMQAGDVVRPGAMATDG